MKEVFKKVVSVMKFCLMLSLTILRKRHFKLYTIKYIFVTTLVIVNFRIPKEHFNQQNFPEDYTINLSS